MKPKRRYSKDKRLQQIFELLNTAAHEKGVQVVLSVKFDPPVCVNPRDLTPIYRAGQRRIILEISPQEQ